MEQLNRNNTVPQPANSDMRKSSQSAFIKANENKKNDFSVPHAKENEVEHTQDGTVDKFGKQAIKARTGGWKSGILILINQGLATLAFFGVGVNLVLFLTRVLHQSNASAANNFQIVLLSLSSQLLLLKPNNCGDGSLSCQPPSSLGIGLFYLSIYLVALGNGGYQPSIATFGADQFDEEDDRERPSKVAFFSWFYLALNLGSLFSNTILGYFENNGMWALGFWLSAVAALLSTVVFLAGTRGYRHRMPGGNPLPRFAQVFVAAILKWKLKFPSYGQKYLYELPSTESAISGCRKILHSEGLRFLDKAAIETDNDAVEVEGKPKSPWRLCTVTQVEEVKCILRLLPIWLCTIIYSVVFTQMASLFVEQGAAMNTSLGSFKVPAAAMSMFDIFSVAVWIALYRRVLVPLGFKITGNPKGFSELQRMGVGLIVGMLAMVAAAVVEDFRLKGVNNKLEPDSPSSLSIFWQIPQYALIGASEVFMYVGQLEFFNSQAPDALRSFGSALCMTSISFGNYVSSLLVTIVMYITKKEDTPGWIPGNLNKGHMDRFYLLLAALTSIDFIAYIFCSRSYTDIAVYKEPIQDEELAAIK